MDHVLNWLAAYIDQIGSTLVFLVPMFLSISAISRLYKALSVIVSVLESTGAINDERVAKIVRDIKGWISLAANKAGVSETIDIAVGGAERPETAKRRGWRRVGNVLLFVLKLFVPKV